MKFREHGETQYHYERPAIYLSFLLGVACAFCFFATCRAIYLFARNRTKPVPEERTLTETLRRNDAALKGIASNTVRMKEIARQLREESAWMEALNENLRTNR